MKKTTTYTRLSAHEREEISRALSQGQSYRQIALSLGRSTSTVSRELARLRCQPIYYRATFAHDVAKRTISRERRGHGKYAYVALSV